MFSATSFSPQVMKIFVPDDAIGVAVGNRAGAHGGEIGARPGSVRFIVPVQVPATMLGR